MRIKKITPPPVPPPPEFLIETSRHETMVIRRALEAYYQHEPEFNEDYRQTSIELESTISRGLRRAV